MNQKDVQHKAKRLGRGLSALLGGDSEPAPEAAPEVARVSTPTLGDKTHSPLIEVKSALLTPSASQPRQVFDEAGLESLASSIRQSGVMQPVIVRPSGGGSHGPITYEIVAGERRWRAAQRAGLETIPALVRNLSDKEVAEWSVVENVQREDLNPIEKGRALRRLGEQFGMTQEQIAQRIGIERSSVANFIRLTELEPEIADLISQGKLGSGHGKALLAVTSGTDRVELARQAAGKSWTVRQLEAAARTRSATGLEGAGLHPTRQPEHEAVLIDLERRLAQYLGTKVKIRSSPKGDRGFVELEFYGLDHFDGLLRRMGFDQP